ncbi:ester cyclase [uncultured Deinococcus sp.]|uniref:ester cyclase n=1 Tax=uncultured Deinococcus sp. TaxID=158789 RepID=UPI0025FE119B|nr:ester cyclase [uncultured Deinococcus sp.]
MPDADVRIASDMIERAFNRGDLSAVDELLLPAAVDHQEAPGVNFPRHLKEVVVMLRTAFPDLHFEIRHIMSSGDIIAMHSVMTGTHLGPMRDLAPTRRSVHVRHMHFIRVEQGLGAELWHLWDTPGLMKQLTGPAPTA